MIVFLLAVLCSCTKRGPYTAPLHQSPVHVTKVEFIDGRNEAELFNSQNYNAFVFYTLDSEETASFVEGLLTVEFFIPGWEPSRHLGELAARIYYEDGKSDLIGNNCNYYLDHNFEILDVGGRYPDEAAFYELFTRFVDSSLLPQR